MGQIHTKAPIIVVVTGAAGQISYSLLPHLVSGSIFGHDQPVLLHLLDIPPAMGALGGVIMELEDLALPLYAGAVGTSDPATAFKDADYCLFLGAFPRKEGMERKDVMAKNVSIFQEQGRAVAAYAKPTVKCLVVGNPANTNAAILLDSMAGKIPPENVTALTRLDHNRATAMVAMKAGVPVSEVEGVIIWGNHSSTQYPDVRHATVGGVSALTAIADHAYLEGEMIGKVQKRGAAIIEARKLSSAMYARQPPPRSADRLRRMDPTRRPLVHVYMYNTQSMHMHVPPAKPPDRPALFTLRVSALSQVGSQGDCRSHARLGAW